ncbi:MAG: hypothetical protein ACTJLM_00065 [Ehrlichia sp.]
MLENNLRNNNRDPMRGRENLQDNNNSGRSIPSVLQSSTSLMSGCLSILNTIATT